MPDTLQLLINGEVVKRVMSLTARRSIYHGAGSIEAEIDPAYLYSPIQEPLTYSIRVNGSDWMQGWVNTVSKKASKDGHTCSLRGRDNLQLWLDNDLLDTPTAALAYNNRTLTYILDDILSRNYKKAASYGLTLPQDYKRYMISDTALLQVQRQTLAQIKTTTPHVGESTYDFITRVCTQLGLVVYCGVTGSIIITRLATAGKSLQLSVDAPAHSTATASISADSQSAYPIIESSYEETSDYHSLCVMAGQTMDYDWVNVGTADAPDVQWQKIKECIHHKPDMDKTWKGIPRMAAKLFKETATSSWGEPQVTEMVRAARAVEKKETFRMRYVLKGFGGSSAGQAFDINRLASVTDALYGLDHERYLISSVELSQSRREGSKTTLELSMLDNQGDWPHDSIYKATAAQGHALDIPQEWRA